MNFYSTKFSGITITDHFITTPKYTLLDISTQLKNKIKSKILIIKLFIIKIK